MGKNTRLAKDSMQSIDPKESIIKREQKRKRKKKRIVAIVFIAVVVFFAFTFISLEVKYQKLHSKESQLQTQLEDSKTKEKELNQELKQSNSKEYIEYLARKYLGLKYKDEKVYVTKDEKDTK